MLQALQIFRKDARRFAYEICVLVLLTCGWAWASIMDQRTIFQGPYSRVAAVILPLAWWYLISQLIHEEPLTGDRQFWITRPYSRGSLLAAKALFVVAFINTPLLVGSFVILGAAGYRPVSYLLNFLWIQLTLTATALLLPAALASLTRNLVQFVMTILGIVAGIFGLSLMGHSEHGVRYVSKGFLWADGVWLMLFVALPAVCMLLLQFGKRHRRVSVAVGLAVAVLLMFTDSELRWQTGNIVQSRMFGQKDFESAGASIAATTIEREAKVPDPTGVPLVVPIRISDIPNGETAAPEIIELIFEAPAGQRWSSGRMDVASAEASVFQEDPSPDRTFAWRQRIVMDRHFWETAHASEVTVRGVVWTMFYEHRTSRLAGDGVTQVPGGGTCSVSHLSAPKWLVNCQAPFHLPFNNQGMAQGTGRLISLWDSPFPADFGMSPLSTNEATGEDGEILFLRYDPRAYIERSIGPATVRLE